MMQIVLDTNVIISAILNPYGSPGKILDQVFDQEISLCLSPPLIAEIRRVLRYPKIVELIRRRGRTVEWAEEQRDKIFEIARVTTGQITINWIDTDPEDDKVLECAVEAHADYIISGDQHLKDLSNFQGIPILTPKALLDMLINP